MNIHELIIYHNLKGGMGGGGGFCHKLFAKGSRYNTGSQYLLVQLKHTFIPYPNNDQPFRFRGEWNSNF